MKSTRAFSYSIFLISAILMLIIQQVMFYGMGMSVGTMREENRSFASLPDTLTGRGVGRVVLGRGAVYWLLFMIIGIYVCCVVPAMFGFPQRGRFQDILILLALFVTVCIFFSMTWTTLVTRRESAFLLFLFMSPVCVFLTGFSWPTTAFPGFWKLFSYLFPSTFGCQAFINLNTAGAPLPVVAPQLRALCIGSPARASWRAAVQHRRKQIKRARRTVLPPTVTPCTPLLRTFHPVPELLCRKVAGFLWVPPWELT